MASHFHKIHHFSSQDTPRISYLCLSYVFPKSELSISVGLKSRQLWCTKYFHCISLIIQRTSENVCPLCSTSLQLPINFRTILCLPIALIPPKLNSVHVIKGPDISTSPTHGFQHTISLSLPNGPKRGWKKKVEFSTWVQFLKLKGTF